MIRDFLSMVWELLKSWKFYIILVASLIITFFVRTEGLAIEGFKMVPATIGILLGGLMTTIAIIFGIIKDEDLVKLHEKHGSKIFEPLKRLKFHILLVLMSLFVTLFSFFIDTPLPLHKLINFLSIADIQVFCFIQVFFSLLTLYLTTEVINIFFLIFEIKFTILTRER